MTVSFIVKLIQSELDLGRVVDVEKHCEVLHHAFPDLSHHQIQDIILKIVAERGGGAVWGAPDDKIGKSGGLKLIAQNS